MRGRITHIESRVEAMITVVKQAIKDRKILELRYHGFFRVVEPHAYGRDKSGQEVLRCYQVSGGSASGERTGWKLLKLREIYTLHIANGRFVPRPDYKRNDKDMTNIFEQI